MEESRRMVLLVADVFAASSRKYTGGFTTSTSSDTPTTQNQRHILRISINVFRLYIVSPTLLFAPSLCLNGEERRFYFGSVSAVWAALHKSPHSTHRDHCGTHTAVPGQCEANPEKSTLLHFFYIMRGMTPTRRGEQHNSVLRTLVVPKPCTLPKSERQRRNLSMLEARLSLWN